MFLKGQQRKFMIERRQIMNKVAMIIKKTVNVEMKR